jgi:xylan 1,4-beta-xylosidase
MAALFTGIGVYAMGLPDLENTMITNPILKGFNPDPSIIRVGDDYYIATSTFEWFPGVQIHHSRDLVHWRVLTRPLNERRLLELQGMPNSGGIWAPCLSYADGLFWLCYTVVNDHSGAAKDTPNYLTTAADIEGPWSDPVHLNSSGFDPSLFHDTDGRKWFLNMVWDHRPGRHPFYGIDLQEYDPTSQQLIGEPLTIFKGTELGRTEGAHLYRRNGYYYLMTAEGGTGIEHVVSLARSKTLEGPYEVHPTNPILTSWKKEHLALQKAGHGDLVETQNGEWYMVHLCSRPLPENKRCNLGRETAIQKVTWHEDDWLYLAAGGNDPQVNVPAPNLPSHPFEPAPALDHFDSELLEVDYQTLRGALDEGSASLTERPGFLRLKGGAPLESKFGQVLVARRQQAFCCTATTQFEFEPKTFQQMAGLVCYYSTQLYHYCCMSMDEELGPCLYIQTLCDGVAKYPLGESVIPLPGASRVWLRAEINYHVLQFSFSLDGVEWKTIGGELDASILSDNFGAEWGFTGSFIGMTCQDMTGRRNAADFDSFEIVENDEIRFMSHTPDECK